MIKRSKLSKAERSEIEILRNKGYSMRTIAKVLGRSPNTISYELIKNAVGNEYKALKANKKAHLTKRMSKFQWKKINQDEVCRTYIIERLKVGWNPDEISGVMKKDNEPFYVSKTAIYDWLQTNRGQKYCIYLHSQRSNKKRRVKKTKRVMIPDRVSIYHRFKGADTRSRYGHWEEDTVVSGRKGTGALSVMIERKSRYVYIRKLKGMRPGEHLVSVRNTMKNINKLNSITFDNGIENKYHKQLGVPTFFCEPYSSWQKGSVENLNKMIRKYIPKGSDISQYSEEYIAWIQNRINEKPRKILGYRCAREVAILGGVIR
jgi:IS30 family transposase